MKLKIFLLSLITFIFQLAPAQDRWLLEQDGSITWNVRSGDPHSDNMEMSGRFISLIISYGVSDKGELILSKQLVFPMLRMIPNDTHASLLYTFSSEAEPQLRINSRPAHEIVQSFNIRGILTISGILNDRVKLTRMIFPSVDKPCAIEKCTLENLGTEDVTVEIEEFEKVSHTQPARSFYGVYEISAKTLGSGIFKLKAGEKMVYSVLFSGRRLTDAPVITDVDNELAGRMSFISMMFGNLTFDSPDPIINRMFSFAKVRSMESIFETKGGLVHSPGGGSYYAAIWANDQAEYANPFFAYTGYQTAISAGMNSWRWFSKYMNADFKPIPSSIIAEGIDYWNGAGDRGDQAMIAYGASRFALALGDRKMAEELWPLIEWCIEYCSRKINKEGVVTSDSDELEGRFPSGNANLCTSSLFYDALISASYLARDLGKPGKLIASYTNKAKLLRQNIEKYFGANMNGYETYRYYDGNTLLRSWICIPLTTGIYDRAKGTLDALFSKDLWTDQGLLTEAGSTTFWDRSTLYGLRGAFAAGETDRALKFLSYYSDKRLLGDHVPYAVEAWPEGNQRHLSAESALYCRIITEGLLGFRPTGLNSFSLTPQLPKAWDRMSLGNMKAFGNKKIDFKISREGDKINVSVFVDDRLLKSAIIKNGTPVEFHLN